MFRRREKKSEQDVSRSLLMQQHSHSSASSARPNTLACYIPDTPHHPQHKEG